MIIDSTNYSTYGTIQNPETFQSNIARVMTNYEDLNNYCNELEAKCEELESELAKDIKIKQLLNTQIKSLQQKSGHYNMPDWMWEKFEDIRKENNIPYWESIVIVPTCVVDSYTLTYKDQSYTEYADDINKNFEYLDKIDFIPYLEKYNGCNIYKLMDAVEADYDDTDFTKDNFLHGCIFNMIDRYVLMEYLNKRYNNLFELYEETVEPSIYIKKIK